MRVRAGDRGDNVPEKIIMGEKGGGDSSTPCTRTSSGVRGSSYSPRIAHSTPLVKSIEH